ncbi:CoA pyrophosphatase [Natronosporangium hydrolyticum]|uniref:CoA pyrophosphatase n=1 Tax=Natronosporangium hydrolyticum TaxID=2811111 RepID=A0A895YGB8_9ACTN|nr:CoA pyrophosphatase [Natronosporangium hydrolyticum]QSB14539.1 CoA pyrophosphatase [Natronosporangium hydrolyticum]
MTDSLPDWWQPLASRAATAVTADFTRWPTPAGRGRPSAVLVLLGEEPGAGPDVLLLERAATMRTHAGQVAFPGGAADPGDPGATGTALREATEEVGLDPGSATVVTELPQLWIPVSDFVVTPVLAWWHAPHQVYPRATDEVSRVARLPVAALADPANRLRVRHPSGYVGPAFSVDGLLVWGFTAGVLATLLELAGWARPWSQDRVDDLPREQAWPVR